MSIKLYEHQKEVLQQTKDFNKVAYYLDMGLGKTYCGSYKAVSFEVPILIVCPKSLVPQWFGHFKSTHPDWARYDLTKKKQLENFIIDDNNLRIGVINYESAWRRPELQKLTGLTLMLDESQAIANNTSKQTKGILKLHHDNVVLLSGTPASNARYDKLYTQLKLLGLDMNKRSYEDRYCNFFDMENAGVRFRVLSKRNPYKNVDELKSKMKDLGCVFMKTDEVIDLPEQRFIDVPIPKSKDYKTFEKDGYVDCGEIEYISNGPAQDMLYLRQLCNSKEKLDMLKTLLESTEDRVIVFYNFNCELESLQQIVQKLKRPISYINGHKKNLDCYNEYDNSITLVQYQSGSSGVNLQLANKMIYYSPPVKSDFFEQSKKRIHRIGQEHKCTYWKLVTTNSIEQKIYDTLDLKKDYTDELFRRDK
jgi:SNF2 family DNA or RNA helicase